MALPADAGSECTPPALTPAPYMREMMSHQACLLGCLQRMHAYPTAKDSHPNMCDCVQDPPVLPMG